MKQLRVQFAHGLESSPQGNKARLFAEHFSANTPAMDTHDFEHCVAVHAQALASFRPELLIGSSFGGAVAVALLDRGLWQGPTLLLAQAARRYLPQVNLPANRRVVLVHGLQDEIVPIDDSRELAATGSAGLVELIEVEDDHSLSASLGSGALVQWVLRAAR